MSDRSSRHRCRRARSRQRRRDVACGRGTRAEAGPRCCGRRSARTAGAIHGARAMRDSGVDAGWLPDAPGCDSRTGAQVGPSRNLLDASIVAGREGSSLTADTVPDHPRPHKSFDGPIGPDPSGPVPIGPMGSLSGTWPWVDARVPAPRGTRLVPCRSTIPSLVARRPRGQLVPVGDPRVRRGWRSRSRVRSSVRPSRRSRCATPTCARAPGRAPRPGRSSRPGPR